MRLIGPMIPSVVHRSNQIPHAFESTGGQVEQVIYYELQSAVPLLKPGVSIFPSHISPTSALAERFQTLCLQLPLVSLYGPLYPGPR
jgi:hypothetical protein